ncbi:polysaccharide biosynthesis protein [Halorubrum sp. Ea1]|uniref:flippase n=1 Tax=Halorubrum sp. Ea1 TaxID=1480718 RepID=UPI000BD3FE6E|nr:flippase [Halorubrum sp. Ea1]OYR53904.1 polysaccharide biosynthesis protein [Halorubrum sp. Ea1]
MNNIVRGFISIFGSKIVTLFLGLLITPVLVRLLGSSQYGNYAFLLSILSITMILTNAGIFDGIRKYIAEDRVESNWIEHVFGFYLRIAFILAVSAAVTYFVFSWLGFSDRFFGNKFGIYFYLLGILVISRQANSVARGGLMGLGFEDRSEPLRILKKALFGVFGLSLVYVGHGLVGVLVGQIVSTLIVSILAYAMLFQNLSLRSVFARLPDKFPKKELLSFNSLSVVLILLTASLYHVDILFLRVLTGDQATGYYKAALVVAEFLWFVPNALQTVLLHSSSELWANDRTDRITTLASRTTRYNLSLVLLFAIGLAVLVRDFVPLYFGSGFDAAVLPLLLLLPGVLGFALARPIFAIGQGKGQLRVLILATGTASLINLCLNALLIPTYGTRGAAVATSIGYGSMLVLHVLAARRIGFDPIDDLRLTRIAIVALLAAGIIFGLSSAIDSSIGSLIVVPPIGFVVYAILTLRLSVISPKETELITQRLPNLIREYTESMIRFVA